MLYCMFAVVKQSGMKQVILMGIAALPFSLFLYTWIQGWKNMVSERKTRRQLEAHLMWHTAPGYFGGYTGPFETFSTAKEHFRDPANHVYMNPDLINPTPADLSPVKPKYHRTR